MPTFVHGKSVDFRLDNSGGSLTDISNVCDSVSFPKSIETADTTAFGSSNKSYIVGLQDSNISVSGKWDATVDAHLAAVVGQSATLSFQYGPAGTTVSNIKYTGECLVTSYDLSSGVGDVVTFSLALQVTGAVTRGTY